MKTTDSVMRELNEEIEGRLQMIPHPDDRRKFRGLIQRIRTADKKVYSHSLAEARREWVEEMRKSVKGLMLVEWIEHGRDCEEGLRPCGAVEHPDRLADRCDIRHFDPTTIQKVIDLLTGDNPERKV